MESDLQTFLSVYLFWNSTYDNDLFFLNSDPLFRLALLAQCISAEHP